MNLQSSRTMFDNANQQIKKTLEDVKSGTYDEAFEKVVSTILEHYLGHYLLAGTATHIPGPPYTKKTEKFS